MVYDVIIIGTGAGGSTIAKELSQKALDILILEKGSEFEEEDAIDNLKTRKIQVEIEKENDDKNYEFLKYPVEIMYVEGLGGTTPVSLANACYACSSCYSNSATEQFKLNELELFEELLESSKDLNVSPLPLEFMGNTTRKIAKAGEKLGFFMEPMPKFIDFSLCDKCGQCLHHCHTNAKWNGRKFIKQAVKNGATLFNDFKVDKIKKNNDYIQVQGTDKEGRKRSYSARKVVLAAGALNTPQILKNSGIDDGVGEGLFLDIFISVGGYLKNAKLNQEIPMGVKSEFGPYFISPHFSNQMVPLLKEKGHRLTSNDVVGLMVKIADEGNGKIHKSGIITKTITTREKNLLKEGYQKSVDILLEMGVDPSTIVSTSIRGAHPGGTAAMGLVVDNSLETSIKGLYVVDASVIPQAPGRPPILTLTALAKKLAKTIISDLN
ncbi:MAG: GMC family oxidoreductase [Methanobacteriaceae archaeon]